MSRLVVAIDAPVPEEAERVVDELYDFDVIFKIGLESLLGYAGRILRYCEERDVRYCVDAKLHDIPRTVGAASRQLVAPAMRMLTVHALGGVEMMRAAIDGVRERADALGVRAPHVFAVTLLTSIAHDSIVDLGLSGSPAQNVMRLASLARDAGCSGVVCSPREVREIKGAFGDDLLTLVPGVRPAGSPSRDQQRIGTPGEAAVAGADYIVVGRPILDAPDRRAATEAILGEIAPYDR